MRHLRPLSKRTTVHPVNRRSPDDIAILEAPSSQPIPIPGTLANTGPGSRRRPPQPDPAGRGPQAQVEGTSHHHLSPTSGHQHLTYLLRPLCPVPAPSSWTSSALAASPSPPSSRTPKPSSSAPAAPRSFASPLVARPVLLRAALSAGSRRFANESWEVIGNVGCYGRRMWQNEARTKQLLSGVIVLAYDMRSAAWTRRRLEHG